MKFTNYRVLCLLVGLASVLGAQPAVADDSEVFTSSAFKTGEGVRPNVLFVIDTSGSMDSEVITYDPSIVYPGHLRRELHLLEALGVIGQLHAAGLHDHQQVQADLESLPRFLRRPAGRRAGGTAACSS
jgi:hypothetical protein